ncbi:MAG TPA: hypothetical protein VN689_09595 [Burkholderiales bacterium]|nr:hypothetical protein [Burkholderiales bacterium]
MTGAATHRTPASVRVPVSDAPTPRKFDLSIATHLADVRFANRDAFFQ